MNALALFWVTDSLSERSVGAPTGTNVTQGPPIYEISQGSSRHKDPGLSIDEMVLVNHRQSRYSWSPFMALDRGFKTMFSREPAPRETGTVDFEVSSRFDRSPAQPSRLKNSDCGPH